MWASPAKLLSHFAKHGPRLGLRAVEDYEQSALGTIRTGRRFAYDDHGSGERRVGYFDRATGLLTALTDDETEVVTHFAPRRGEQYVRDLPASTYT